jgi:hypothetical protein
MYKKRGTGNKTIKIISKSFELASTNIYHVDIWVR